MLQHKAREINREKTGLEGNEWDEEREKGRINTCGGNEKRDGARHGHVARRAREWWLVTQSGLARVTKASRPGRRVALVEPSHHWNRAASGLRSP